MMILLFAFLGLVSSKESPLTCLDSTGTCYQGGWFNASSGVQFASFQGIRYAQPPLGSLRFKPPQPLQDPSIGTIDVSKEIDTCCIQMDGSGQEDCLLLNVYVPEKIYFDTSGTKYPVMYWVYGGGFVIGENSFKQYGPHPYMDKDVIIVAVNYRLGPFGFLSIGNLDVFGNAGLMDQNLGLQWVQENIINFGGDNDAVTIFGESAGGASISLNVYAIQYFRVFSIIRITFLTGSFPHVKRFV